GSPARASIVDFRLVPDQTPDGIKTAVERYLRAQGYHLVREPPDAAARQANARIVRVEWDSGYPGVRTPMDLPFSRAVANVASDASGGGVVLVPNLGGSLPLYVEQEVLKAPLAIIPIANHDNNQHAANENLRLKNLWDGIGMFAFLFARLGPAWTEDSRGVR
ncbi:MAG TPA: hypothetical protein VKE49_07975, partial [Myxococcaceae bacterium]|nr:hypothetical protein [Myxococcaceae bacterium]